MPDDDPAAKPIRRRFSAAYKLAILDEYAETTDPGAKGALLRKRSKRNADKAEIERLRRKTERLESQLQKHRQVLEIQGKASEALSRLLAEAIEEETQQLKRREP